VPNALQQLNDSAAGVVIGTTLHTLGAIGLLGGLVGYIAWHRHLHRGHHHVKVLNGSIFLAYISILINLLGGFMRTYETGHPHLTDFGTSGWVRAITIKHAFLFVGMAAAVYLFERVAPRHLKAMKAGTLPEESMTGHALGVLLVALGIMVAAVLGAVSTVLPVGAMADGGNGVDDPDDPTSRAVRYENATGQLAGFIPAQPVASQASFEVAAGTRSLNATLVWDPATSCLRLNLVPPGSDVPTDPCVPVYTPGFPPEAPPTTGVRTVNIADPQPGTWRYVIDAQGPVQATWSLSIAMPTQGAGGSLFATVTVNPGGAYEINTHMPLNGTINWDWVSTATLHFNVHSHFDGVVQDYVDVDATDGRDAYTNNRAGGYSLFWTNDGTTPATLTYEVWGDFTLDSIFAA
jgi:hypothetical protein